MATIKKSIIGLLCVTFALFMCIGLTTITTVDAESTDSLAVTGVSLRVKQTDEDYYGLRFDATISTYDSNAQYGIQIVPDDLKEDDNKIEKVYRTPVAYGDSYTFNAALLNILPANLSRPFTARAFKEEDGVIIETSDWFEAKSIFTIATQALADKSATFGNETEDFLEGVVNTVLGKDSSLTGEYVFDSVSYANLSSGLNDMSDVANGDDVKIALLLKKDGDESKIIKAYPSVDALTAEDSVIQNGIVPVNNTQDTFTLPNEEKQFKLKFSLAENHLYTTDAFNTEANGYRAVNLHPGAVVGADGVTHTGQYGSFNGSGHVSSVNAYKNNFIDLGEYGVGYKFVATFKGNNVPQILLFANNQNGCLGCGDATNPTNIGYLISNGVRFTDGGIIASNWEDLGQPFVLGPNRISFNLKTTFSATELSNNLSMGAVSSFFPKASEFNAETTYRYEIWTTENESGQVVFYVKLYDTDETNAQKYCATYNTNKTKTEIESAGKFVQLHAGIKGEGANTRFAYKVEEIEQRKITTSSNADGSTSYVMTPGYSTSIYSLGNGTVDGSGWGGDLKAYANNYFVLGEYGVGYKFITTFTGNNLPQFMLFANNVDGVLSGNYGGKGYYLSNGVRYRGWNNPAVTAKGEDALYVHSETRIHFSLAETITASNTNIKDTSGKTFPTQAQFEASNITYKYEVWSAEGSDGKVTINVKLSDATTLEELFNGTFATDKTVSEIETLGKNVIIYAGIKGQDKGTSFNLFPVENLNG